ncbi:class I SAM-dependent methyltransferase [Hymenobacter sp. BT188]|uniref:class I SAM-dependent methyltransferase n=1 Tax=Hymenobacter sp. BT188 TaxID=2763504 RepID=UPI001651560A|nr:class I SAM-dependent methyltransferase [Hymenobacter sp. BT188]MBC6606567.1 class I SAM-dependent methyltransferase [Hymenobacter sp. BT188]
MKTQLRNMLARVYRSSEYVVRENLHLFDSDTKLVADSQHYWDSFHRDFIPGKAHWRGTGIFVNDDERWLKMGRHNYNTYRRLAGVATLDDQPARIVDWGCGGGANAMHFAPGSSRYYGADVTEATVKECQKQLAQEGYHNFVPVPFKVATPETVLSVITEPIDLFLCVYVFCVFPTKTYGSRVLDIAFKLLKPGGQAFIEIRYADHTPISKPHRWGYAQNMPHMVTYRIEEFWEKAISCGFEPQLVTLELEQEVRMGKRYAYYLLTKPV